jgi:pyruvate dehydrogenase E2 component (dihydrolipoyllysine-residue acetyltransferase)
MSTDVVMPQMGESVVEGTITKWLKKPGDTVQRDEPLFEISTDKVDAEIPSPASGVLKEVKVKEGATVQVNTVVGVIDADGVGAAATSPAKAAAPPSPSAPPPVAPPAAAAPAAPVPAAAPAPSGLGTEVTMPQMGESIVEGTITKWLKQVGDQIGRDEPLFEISTDKVDAEIPAPAAGVLSEIRVAAGQTVGVNTVVAVIGGTGAPAAAAAAPSPVLQAPVAAPAAPAAPAPVAEEEEETVVEGRRIRSSPLVRKIAKENNVNLAQVKGTGLSGRITKEDILNFVQSGGAKAAAPASITTAAVAPTAKPLAPAPAPAAPSPLVGQVVPMTQMRKIIAQRMVESKHTSAHVHSVYEIDMTHVMNLRAKLKNKFEQTTGSKLTPTTFFARAAVKALREFPIINASVEGDNINYHREINVGIAVALDWGLIVPVIKHAEEKSFLGLQRAISDLGDRARAKKLLPDDVQGGTFTITNPGQFGQMFGLPIILQPQVAIMGIGSIKKMPVVVTDASRGDSIAIRSICHISLGYDHRVIDGAVADQFLRSVAQHLENWNEELM